MLTEDLRCVKCNGDIVVIEKIQLYCKNCETEYPIVLGVPYFGGFEESDILGLIEIAANVANRKKFGVNPAEVERWELALKDYHNAENKEDYRKNNAVLESPYFNNRYGEWKEINTLIDELDLRTKKVLDIGAGLGWDSHRLHLLGANVTALEYSPLLAESGKENFPQIRWIGGFSHILPFKNNCFDAAFCNAALHHMRDVSKAISEALRVLKPGGVLITTCDSFRSNCTKEDFELRIFDAEPAVLMGVNEGIPRLSEFISPLVKHSQITKVEIFTHELDGFKKKAFSILNLFKKKPTFQKNTKADELFDSSMKKWSFERDLSFLKKQSGSLALRIKLKEPWPEKAPLQRDTVLSPSRFAEWLLSGSDAIQKLAPLMPDRYVDLPFPGKSSSKFELLNGWRLPQPYQHLRTAYKRGRWFLKKPVDKNALQFQIKATDNSSEEKSKVIVLVDGNLKEELALNRNSWTTASIDISNVGPGQTFAIEIKKLSDDMALDQASFLVKERRFVISDKQKNKSLQENNACVYVVIPVFNRWKFTKKCIQQLLDQTYSRIRIVLSDGGSTDETLEETRRLFTDVVILESENELWWTGAMEEGIKYILNEANNNDFLLMMNNDTEIAPNYVEQLITASMLHTGAVSGLIVDSRDAEKVLDAGEYLDWSNYTFSVIDVIHPHETFRDDVDFLPGRGTLVPLEWVRTIGNVNSKQFPHYLGDYDFFWRLKTAGCRLGVSYEAKLLAHIDETGIILNERIESIPSILKGLFARRSMHNVIDHWRFISAHAPRSIVTHLKFKLFFRILHQLFFRTHLRYVAHPLLRYFVFPIYLILTYPVNQVRMFGQLKVHIKEKGDDILCYPSLIPSSIRLFVYLLFCPGPIEETDCQRFGISLSTLLANGTVRNLNVKRWYKFNTISPIHEKERELLAYSRKLTFKLTRGIRCFLALQKQNK